MTEIEILRTENRRQGHIIKIIDERLKQLEIELSELQAQHDTMQAEIDSLRAAEQATRPVETIRTEHEIIIPPDWNLAGAPKQGLYRL